jgi:hypothetical protein
MDNGAGGRIKARLLREELTQRVRNLATKGKIDWSDHAFERMEERGIDALTAERVLTRGDIHDDPEPGKRKGEWKVKMVHRVTQGRDVGVVTIVVGTKSLRVATVEWEDL